jgi:hypothetical protein
MTMIAYEALSAQELMQTYNQLATKLGVPEVTSKFTIKFSRGSSVARSWRSSFRPGNLRAMVRLMSLRLRRSLLRRSLQEESAQEESAQEESAQEEPAQEEPEEDDLSLSDDPKEAASQLHAFFGDPELPSPEEQRAQAQEAKLKAPKVQSEPPAERIQVDVSDPEAVFKAFKVREGTNKHRLLTAMIHAMGQPLSLSTMLKAAYGKDGVGNEGSLMMIVKGITVAIAKNRLPFEVRKTRVAKVLHLALIHLEESDA